jgi:hypothetical protein
VGDQAKAVFDLLGGQVAKLFAGSGAANAVQETLGQMGPLAAAFGFLAVNATAAAGVFGLLLGPAAAFLATVTAVGALAGAIVSQSTEFKQATQVMSGAFDGIVEEFSTFGGAFEAIAGVLAPALESLAPAIALVAGQLAGPMYAVVQVTVNVIGRLAQAMVFLAFGFAQLAAILQIPGASEFAGSLYNLTQAIGTAIDQVNATSFEDAQAEARRRFDEQERKKREADQATETSRSINAAFQRLNEAVINGTSDFKADAARFAAASAGQGSRTGLGALNTQVGRLPDPTVHGGTQIVVGQVVSAAPNARKLFEELEQLGQRKQVVNIGTPVGGLRMA